MTRLLVPDVHVQLLGPLRLHINGTQIDTHGWKSKKALTLFKFLVARNGERHPKDVLIELLWPDSDDVERSTHNLHTVIYYLRRELEPELSRYEHPRLLRHAAGLYWFERGPSVQVDVDQFLQLIRDGERLQERDPQEALQCYRQALDVYRDDFLPEDLYEDWAAGLREHLRERYIGVVMAAAHLIDTLGGDRAYAIRHCRAALQREPFREELHRMLILHLVKGGLHAEAVTQYRRCQRVLDEEFGLAPSAETVAVYELLGTPVTSGADTAKGESRPTTSPGSGEPAVGDGVGRTNGLVPPEETGMDGPLLCNREMYAFLHKLELRRQARTGAPVTLLRITLDEAGGEKASRKATCVRVLKERLRSGDVFCWEAPNQLVIQLTAADEAGGAAVKSRVQRGLEEAGLLFFDIRFSVIVQSYGAEPTDGAYDGAEVLSPDGVRGTG